MYIFNSPYVTLDHKTGLKALEYMCSNSQQFIVWVKIIFYKLKFFFFYAKNH